MLASTKNQIETRNSPAPYLRALALGIPAILLGLQISGWIGFAQVIADGHADFRQLYTAGYMLRSGARVRLYDYGSQLNFQNRVVSPAGNALPFNHLAYEALLFAPLSYLPFRTAYFVFLTLNLGLIFVLIRILRVESSNLKCVWSGLPAAMLLTFTPISACLMQGQDSIILLALLAGAYVLIRKDQLMKAGALAASGLFKFQVIVPLAVLLFLAGRRRFAIGVASVAAVVSATSVWIAGIPATLTYLRELVGMSAGLSTAQERFRFGIVPTSMANLRGLIYGIFNGSGSNAWMQTTIGILSLVLLLWSARVMTRIVQPSESFLVGIVTSSLLSYHFLIHDMSVLIVPILVTLNRHILGPYTSGLRAQKQVWSSVALFLVPMWIAFSARTFFLVAIPVFLYLWALAGTPEISSVEKREEVFITQY